MRRPLGAPRSADAELDGLEDARQGRSHERQRVQLRELREDLLDGDGTDVVRSLLPSNKARGEKKSTLGRARQSAVDDVAYEDGQARTTRLVLQKRQEQLAGPPRHSWRRPVGHAIPDDALQPRWVDSRETHGVW